MRTEWERLKLASIAKFTTGKLDSNAAQINGIYPFFTCSPETLSINTYAFDTEAILLAGNNANANFPIKYYKGKFNAYQRTYIIESKDIEKLNNKFLFYSLQNSLLKLKELSIGSATKFLTKTILDNLDISCPDIWEQKRVVEILGGIDDRIALLRETNTTLEAIAQALFKSWFVDFDPVHAKQQGRAPEGMDAQTAALFPDSFEESELGMVPKGWSYSTVGQSFILTMGQSPPGDTYNENGEGLPFYQGRTDFGFRFPSQRIFCSAPTRFAEKGDTLVSVRAPVGDVNMALERCCIGRGVASVRHPMGYSGFAFYAMRSLGKRFKTFDSEGTVFGSISKKDFQNLPVIEVSEGLLRVYDSITSSLDTQIVNNELIVRSLTALRNTLLPRLISGQLRLPEAQDLVEDAVDA